MSSKTLTASVKLNTKSAERSIDRLSHKFNQINTTIMIKHTLICQKYIKFGNIKIESVLIVVVGIIRTEDWVAFVLMI